MSRETMLSILEEELGADENKPIQPLTETPAKVYKPKNLTEAEDEIQERDDKEETKDEEYREEHNPEEDDTDTNTDEVIDSIGDANTSDEELDDKLMQFTIHQLLSTKFIKMEYGSPSGSDSFCPTCGNEDAADAAIIDNEISGAERTEPFGSVDSGSSGGFGGGSDNSSSGDLDDDMDMDFSFYYRQRIALEHCVPGTESFTSALRALFNTGERIFHSIFKTASRVVRFVLRVSEHNFIKVRYMAKFYQFKFKKFMNFVDDDELAEIKIEAWCYDDWCMIKEKCSVIYRLCRNIANQINANPNQFKNIKNEYAKNFNDIYVDISDIDDKNSTHHLYKRREYTTLSDLGYSKRNVIAVFRQLEELGSMVDKSAMASINEEINKAAKYIKNETSRIKKMQNNKVDETALKHELDTITAYRLRFDYLVKCVKIYTMITDQLVSDLYKISESFETSIAPKYMR